MYIGHGRLCVCLSLAAFPYYCTDPDVISSGCPLVVHYWADLQSVHGFRCYDNVAPNAKCQRVLVLAVCLVDGACKPDKFNTTIKAVLISLQFSSSSLHGPLLPTGLVAAGYSDQSVSEQLLNPMTFDLDIWRP